jgi:2-(1,2-epoxy-1,2-dihydrophenyl)acetyl-CoA isomerase
MTVETTPVETEEAAPVLASTDAGVLTITLNRPHVLNAFSTELLEALGDVLRRAQADPDVRALVITGAGRGFSSGADLKARMAAEDLDIRALLHQYYVPVITAISSMEKPVIAAVNGVAAGAGFSLALAADLRLAAESATFMQAFVRVGLVPDAGSTFFLPALIGYARAAELMMLGDTIDAARAYELGIVNRVLPESELVPMALELAGRLARGPRSIGLIKRLLRHTREADFDLESQLALEADAQSEASSTADFVEGISAFLQKRRAEFTGR